MSQNRYDALRKRIDREFSRSVTLNPSLTAGEQATVFNLDDHTDTYELDEPFEKFGPFNAITVRNRGDTDIRVYLNQERTAFVTIPAAEDTAVAVMNRVPSRYVRYLRVENLDDANPNDGVEMYVGNDVDSVELDLLKMGGLLDVQG